MITLLNGEKWKEADILAKMDDDSFYYGYLKDKVLSSSSAKPLLKSPKAYLASLRQSEDTQPLRDGKLVHMHILEPHKLTDLSIVSGNKTNKPYKDAVANGLEVYTESEVNNAFWIANAVAQNRDAAYLLSDCDYEVPAIKMIDGIPFRGKADAITKDRRTIIDIKTTSSDISDFSYSAKNFNYGLQAYLYLELFGASEFIFIVVNKMSKDIGIFDCSEFFLSRGGSDLSLAIANYKEAFINNDNSEDFVLNYVIRGTL